MRISELTYEESPFSIEDLGEAFATAIDSSQLVLYVVIGILILITLAAINYVFKIRKNKRLGDAAGKRRKRVIK